MGVLVIPLARNFNNTTLDIESGTSSGNKVSTLLLGINRPEYRLILNF